MEEKVVYKIERVDRVGKVLNIGKKVLIGTLAIIGGVVVLVVVETVIQNKFNPEGVKQDQIAELQERLAELTTE